MMYFFWYLPPLVLWFRVMIYVQNKTMRINAIGLEMQPETITKASFT